MRVLGFVRALGAVTVTVFMTAPAYAQAQSVPGQGTWESTLQARDVGNTGTTNAFYDTVLNITWLRNANVNGSMDWNTATAWASNLTFGSTGGWRLPTVDPNVNYGWSMNGSTSMGYNVAPSSSEMAHLFASTLGNIGIYDSSGLDQSGGGLTNTGGFQDLQAGGYWSDTPYAPNPVGAFGFYTNSYFQTSFLKGNQLYAMAVHPGDVGAVVASVPEPETYAMLLAGLGLIGVIGRRRSRT